MKADYDCVVDTNILLTSIFPAKNPYKLNNS